MITLDSLEIVDKDNIQVSWFDNGNHWETWDSGDLFNHIVEQYDEIERLNNIINELDKQNGELGAELSIIKDRIDKTNWWLEQMLKQATNNETKAIINGALELLLGSDKE